MRLYLDTEFTGLHKNTTLISIGVVSDDGKTFYAELSDYDEKQIDSWLKENIIDNLYIKKSDIGRIDFINKDKTSINVYGNKKYVKNAFKLWFEQFENIEIWSDCLAYDWVLFNDLFEHAFNIPNNIYYIPFDICTLFKIKNIDPDISREEFINNCVEGKNTILYMMLKLLKNVI